MYKIILVKLSVIFNFCFFFLFCFFCMGLVSEINIGIEKTDIDNFFVLKNRLKSTIFLFKFIFSI